jgi:hypothetical protein
MMLRLILNVLCKRCHLRLADRKAALASLPSEAPSSLALQPAGGMALERLNQFRNLLGTGQTEEGVHMVSRAANGYGGRPHLQPPEKVVRPEGRIDDGGWKLTRSVQILFLRANQLRKARR